MFVDAPVGKRLKSGADPRGNLFLGARVLDLVCGEAQMTRHMRNAISLWWENTRTPKMTLGSAILKSITVGITIIMISGCQDVGSISAVGPIPVTGQNPGDVKYYPSDEPLRLGLQRFNEGNFGLAQQYFQDAVEKTPKDVAAWIGLAASYDRLARFDLADRAYASAVRLAGHTQAILNNEGYSYLLRGDLNHARAKFQAALKLDPNNQTTLNNIALLDSSSRFVSRPGLNEACADASCTQ
jgi:hypothetical protein